MMSTVWPFFTGFLIAAILIPLLIDWQRRRHVGQQIYEDGPKTHAAKQGTPTMGGTAFVLAAIAGLAFSHNQTDGRIMLLTVGAGAIGALDDLVILLRRRALGLRARWKFGLLAVLAVLVLAAFQSGDTPAGFTESWFGGSVSLAPWLWWLLSLAAVVGAANAVNLTDGVDGLAASTVLPPLVLLALVSLSSVAVAVAGACAAFLFFNRYPAKIFMGDAGSLSLGALLAGCAIAGKFVLLLPLAGIVFVAEALSVIAQVAAFKLTGKRVLKMSPLHHHFELSGWNERRVTWTFATVSIAATFATVIGLLMSGSGGWLAPGGWSSSP